MINKFLLETVIYLIEIIKYLMTLLVGKNLLKSISDEPVKKDYRKLQVDDQPIFDVPEKLNYKLLIAEYELKHGKEFAPVKPRKNKALVPKMLAVLSVVLHITIFTIITEAEDNIFAKSVIPHSILKITIRNL